MTSHSTISDGPGESLREHVLSPVLVGRQTELDLLMAAAGHAPAVAIVEGEAGVGKTRLIEELILREVGHQRTVVLARSLPLVDPFPLGAVLEAARQLGDQIRVEDLDPVAGAVAPHLPEIAARLPGLPEPLGDPGAERHRLFRGLAEVFRAAGRLTLVLEDLHWADPATLEFVQFLLQRMPPVLFLVVSLRPEELQTSSFRLGPGLPRGMSEVRLHLEPLLPEEVGHLVGAILESADVSETFASYLHERTAGLPFAVEELVMLMRARRDLVRREGQWVRRSLDEISVPSRVRDFILARLETLSPPARSLVESASVFRTAQGRAVLEGISGLDENQASEALSEAIAARLLLEEAPGRYTFRHPLAREAVEDIVPAPLRTSLHLRAAHSLQENKSVSAAEIAHHFKQAGESRDWVRFAEVGADQASEAGDDVTAARLLAQALGTPGLDLDDRARIALKLGKAAKQGLAHHEALPLLRPLLQEPGLSPERRGELRLRVAWLLHWSGNLEECMSEVSVAIAELEHEPGLAARAMSTLASPLFRGLHVDEHLVWLDRASATVGRSDDAVAKVAVAVDRAAVLLEIGRADAWAAFGDIPRSGESIEERRQLVRGYANLSYVAAYLGHQERAAELLREGSALAREVGAHRERGFMVDATTLVLDFIAGRWETIRARAERSIETWGDLSVDVEAELVLGALDLAQGELDLGEERLLSVSERARSTGDSLAEAFAAGRLCHVRLARRDPAAAWPIANRFLDSVRSKGIWSVAGEIVVPAVRALLAQDLGDARALETELSAGLADVDAPSAQAMLPFARGLIAEAGGDLDLASTLFAQAVVDLEELPRPYEAAAAREAWGRAGSASGDPAGAARLAEALAVFEALGCNPDIARVKGELRRAGVGFGHRRGRKGYGEELSPREQEVLQLISTGRTSREVAASLFLSPRTVDSHVSRIMRKLGVDSRRDLARNSPEPANENIQ
ncbi:MAG: ATP-binding protein [Actinomycetota bacterium]